MEWNIASNDIDSLIESDSAMRMVYKTIIENPLAWIGTDKSNLDKKFLISKAMMIYWEEKEEFEICNDYHKICQIIMMIKENKFKV